MTHVQWARGIGGDELHVRGSTTAGIAAAVRLVGPNQRGDALRDDVGVDAEVDESRTGDLRRANSSAPKIECLHDSLGELARLAVQWLREYESKVRRPIAKGGVARPFQDRLDGVGRAK